MPKVKTILLSILTLFIFSSSQAQESTYIHGLYTGGQYSFVTEGDDAFDALFIGYYSRFQLDEKNEKSSIGIASYLNGGYTEGSPDDILDNIQQISTIFVSLPLVLEFNYGTLATRDSYSKYGFFTGLGLDYTHSFNKVNYEDLNGNYVDSTNNKGVLSADVSFGIRYSLGVPISFRFSTKIGFNGKLYYTVASIIPFHKTESIF